MTHTYYLKNPKTDSDSLIYFSSYFKRERKKFVYSTGEKINPKQWDSKNNRPYLKEKNKAKNAKSIINQLNRYRDKFDTLRERLLIIDEEFNSAILRKEFDKEFKREITSDNYFFESFDKFVGHKKNTKSWSEATIKKYNTLKIILKEFETLEKYRLTFSTINNSFLEKYTNYCYVTRDHSTNTFRRNLGLFKTFMNWAYDNNLTYNDTFKKFEKPKAVVPKKIALTKDEIKTIYNHKFKSKKLERVRDVFILQCLTGLRYKELSRISKSTVKDNHLLLNESKDIYKVEREIPLADVALNIIEKYDFSLPLMSNQKYNDYIKNVIKEAGINYEVEVSRVQGKTQTFRKDDVSQFISSHTARSSFITNMKNAGIADKTIMSITGHKDLKTFLTYYRVNSFSKEEAVTNVFSDL